MFMVLLQTQSAAGAALVIIVMLLGAAIIGVLTTYFYMRSRDRRAMESLQSKLETREREISHLKSDLEAAKNELSESKEKLEQLENKYDALEKKEGDLLKAAAKSKATSEKLNETEEKLEELEELLKRISEKKHMINYTRIGTARKEEMDDLKMISGIGPHIEQQLHALDIYTYQQISNFTEEDIETVTEVLEYFPGRIERDEWISQAKELVYTKGEESEVLKNIARRKDRINYDRIGIAHKEDTQDLTAINGIGGWIQKKLYALDIFTYDQIARFSEEDIQSVTDVIEFFPGRIERDEWVAQAKELAAGKKA